MTRPSTAFLPLWSDSLWREARERPLGVALVAGLEALEATDFQTPLPVLTPELDSQVHRTGERLPFERVWQERRRRLARAAVRLLLEESAAGAEAPFTAPRGVWWAQLLARVQELLAEPSWAWPAHVRDPSGIDAAVIDLFAAVTAILCGELVSLFGPWLPPAWVEALRQRVVAGMVQPFLSDPAACGCRHRCRGWCRRTRCMQTALFPLPRAAWS